ncbi:MAG: hypothetical protein JJU29_21715 [Verrucomicrobia bacterium]|nr:hypothetical protein [Verrucomicrobiota bacterium]MCH8513791.1 hypothetical protein [Kiritimatiellia bacterium]
MKFRKLLFLCPCLLLAAEHPRLLLGPEDVPALREKIRGEPFASMVRTLREGADHNHWGRPGPMESEYDHIYSGHRHAFLYLLSGDDAHARIARERVEYILDRPSWANARQKGLNLYINGIYAALIYDHCHGAPSWDAEFSRRVSRELLRQHEVIVRSGGTGQNNNSASNWQGLRGAAAGIIGLATDEGVNPENLAWAHARVTRYLNDNPGSDPETRGWNIEGLGYTYYPFGNGVMPFAIAARRAELGADLFEHPGLRMSLWTVYAALLTGPDTLMRPDFGDDNPGANGEGTMGFAFAVCPPELLPGLKYWYDRTVGMEGDRSFDSARFGTAASILYYPAEIDAAPPLSIPEWREAFVDTRGNGFMTYRNGYEGAGDVVAQLYVKLRGNRGHSGPDALSFRIGGLNTLWATGGGRYGPRTNNQDVFLRSMNTLYPVDPDGRLEISGESGSIVGEPVIHEDGSGHSVTTITQNNLGVRNHTRRFITAFDQGAKATFVVSDTSDDGKFWQMVTVDHNQVTTEGNTFTVTSPEGHSLRGTVLHPARPAFQTGTRRRGSGALGTENNNFIHFSSPDGNYLVVMTLVERGNTHPNVTATGEWREAPNGVVRVGGLEAAIRGNEIRTRPGTE